MSKREENEREEKGWLWRWAPKKAQQKAAPRGTETPEKAEATREPPPDGTSRESVVPRTIAAADAAHQQDSAEALPPVESLTYESDFTPYLSPSVPEELRQQALRKLWRSNPVLANLDGLDACYQDYSMIGKVEEAVETLYQIGRGMVDSVERMTSDADSKADESRRAEIAGSLPDNDLRGDNLSATQTQTEKEERLEPQISQDNSKQPKGEPSS